MYALGLVALELLLGLNAITTLKALRLTIFNAYINWLGQMNIIIT